MRNFESGKDYLSFLLRDTVNLNTERGITMADGDRFDQSSRFPAVPSKRKWSCPTLAVEQVTRAVNSKTPMAAETRIESTVGPAS